MGEFTVEALPDTSHIEDKSLQTLLKNFTFSLNSIQDSFKDIRKTLDVCIKESERIGKECDSRLGDKSISKDERKTLEKLTRHAAVVRKRCERIDL